MKMLRKVLFFCLVLCIAAVFGAILFRIHIADHYPNDTTKTVFTPALEAHYRADPSGFEAFTQDIRFPYDDAKDGSFFAAALVVVPDADHVQLTVRYNKSSLPKVASHYKLPDVPAPADGLFRYTLTVSYNEDKDGKDYKTYECSYIAEDAAYMYRYARIAFDGVELDGAVWARVDIYYKDQSEPFGAIAVYESRTYDEMTDTFVPIPLKKFHVDKEDLPA